MWRGSGEEVEGVKGVGRRVSSHFDAYTYII